jgi:hypothetical protein
MSPRIAWPVYGAVACALALVGVWHWLWAITLRGPVLYGEGAVAHAALLARTGSEYVAGARYGAEVPIFTAANYPPLYFHLASLGDPFVTGRVVSIGATLFVAGAIVWRARAAGRLAAATIAIAWLGSVPVLQWGPAVKPDLVALALTVGAVMAFERTRPMYVLAGALLGLAALSKPTAFLPAMAMWIFVSRTSVRGAAVSVASAVIAAVVVALATGAANAEAWMHVVEWNALPWRADLAAPVVLIALIVLLVPIVTMLVTRPSVTIVTAYAAGAVAILLLGGREGATINYFLDLSAALALGIGGRAPRLRSGGLYPIAGLAQAIVAVLILNPFGIVPGVAQSTGRWGDPVRKQIVRDLPGMLLVEDSGLLVADGREPLVDDLFLWSRGLAARRFPGGPLLAAVREGRFDAVVSEVDLEHLDSGPAYEQQRWHAGLVAAVLDRYQLDAQRAPLFIYTRRAVR